MLFIFLLPFQIFFFRMFLSLFYKVHIMCFMAYLIEGGFQVPQNDLLSKIVLFLATTWTRHKPGKSPFKLIAEIFAKLLAKYSDHSLIIE